MCLLFELKAVVVRLYHVVVCESSSSSAIAYSCWMRPEQAELHDDDRRSGEEQPPQKAWPACVGVRTSWMFLII